MRLTTRFRREGELVGYARRGITPLVGGCCGVRRDSKAIEEGLDCEFLGGLMVSRSEDSGGVGGFQMVRVMVDGSLEKTKSGVNGGLQFYI
ncbi:hypothetical protein BVRB_5g111510 [Beta vulgaris subsp. vulgaris]|nr:hypothetical protein BVRB_5g111510 [Beta vulgaris subsp. vulgaris]